MAGTSFDLMVPILLWFKVRTHLSLLMGDVTKPPRSVSTQAVWQVIEWQHNKQSPKTTEKHWAEAFAAFDLKAIVHD